MLNNEEEIAKLQIMLNNLKNKHLTNTDENTPLLKKNIRSSSTINNEFKPIQENVEVVQKEKPEKVKKPRPPKKTSSKY